MNQQMNRVGSFQALEDEELPDLKGAKEVDVEIYSATKVRSPLPRCHTPLSQPWAKMRLNINHQHSCWHRY